MNDRHSASFGITEQTTPIFEKGDVAVVLKANGEVRPIAIGIDTERLDTLDEANYNDDDILAIEQGKKMFALTFAASTPMLMDLLIQIATDPDVVDLERLGQLARPN